MKNTLGFIKLWRATTVFELLSNPKYIPTLKVWLFIGMEANWRDDLHENGLDAGQIRLRGCPKELGLSNGQWRTALKNLERWGWALVERSRQTGTLVTILDNPIFEVPSEHLSKVTSNSTSNCQKSNIKTNISKSTLTHSVTGKCKTPISKNNNQIQHRTERNPTSNPTSLTNIEGNRREKTQTTAPISDISLDKAIDSQKQKVMELRRVADRPPYNSEKYHKAKAELEALEAMRMERILGAQRWAPTNKK